MPDITTSPPTVGQQSYFRFKQPVLSFIQNKLNTDETAIKLKVIGVNNLRSLLEAELRDPFVDTYSPMGINVEEYRKDVLNDVPLYVFSYLNMGGKTVYIKAPLNYILDYTDSLDITYTNRLIVMDVGKLPATVDTTVIFRDLGDFFYDKLGVRPLVKEVSVGEPEVVTREDHELRESIRKQSITVSKSNKALLEEISLKYNELVRRISDLNIVLG